MKRIIIITAVFIILAVDARAQNQLVFGLRYGVTSGIEMKYIHQGFALEGIIGIWNKGNSFTLLYEKYQRDYQKRTFRWYYGVGAHTSLYSRDSEGFYKAFLYRDNPYKFNEKLFAIGIDATIGLEIKAASFPLIFSFELKPFLEFAEFGQYWVSYDPAIGIKAYF